LIAILLFEVANGSGCACGRCKGEEGEERRGREGERIWDFVFIKSQSEKGY
jgi:hypothetical protein